MTVRLLTITVILVALLGSISAFSKVSTFLEVGLLALIFGLIVLEKGKLGKTGAIPVFNKHTDIFIVIFVSLWCFNALFQGNFGVANMFVLLRYVCIAYLVAKFFTLSDIIKLSHFIVWFGICQLIVGLLQVIGLIPWVLADVGDEKSGIYGVFKDNISYAAILLTSMIIYDKIVGRSHGKKLKIALVLLFLAFIVLSGSRAFTLLALFYILYEIIGVRSKLAWISIISSIMLLGGLFASSLGSSNEDFLFFLSSGYVEMAMHQRLGIFLEVLPQFLWSSDIFLGLGSSKDAVVDMMRDTYDFHYIAPQILPFILEDVYWLVMLFYYGVLGAFSFCVYLFGIYLFSQRLVKVQEVFLPAIHVFQWLFIFAIALGFVGQVFELKAYSLIFWLYVGALVVVKREI